jgi:2-(1,2-epoxy-1,2-dihydrophenyl)acetyl-CoA isomerase
MTQTVLTERRGSHLRIVLNRPDRLNALTADVHAGLRAALAAAEQDEACRAVLLTGAGRAFCAGQDLAEAASLSGQRADLEQMIERDYNPLIRRIRALPKPIVCAVNGIAAGAGANLALACDIVVAARSASFSQAFIHIGLVPDSGGTFFLPRLVGEARARALAMLGDRIAAEQAAAWGMIWQCVDDERLAAEAEALASRLAALPTAAIGLMKRAFDAGAHNDLAAQLALEGQLQRQAGAGPDYAEGVRAFLEKRPPKFTGRD